MQSETSDFAPGAAISWSKQNRPVVSDSAHSLHYVKNDVVDKAESTSCIIELLLEEDRAAATSNIQAKFKCVGFLDIQAHRQNRQTDRQVHRRAERNQKYE